MGLISLNLSSNPPQPQALSHVGRLADVFMNVRTVSGQNVTPETALRASASLACIRVLTEDVAALPLILLEQTPQGAKPALAHPIYRLLKSAPNDWQTSFDLREGMMLDLLLHGNFYVQKELTRDGIAALYPLPASRVSYADYVSDELSRPVLRWKYSGPDGQRVLLQDDLWRGSILAYGVTGRALILLAREAIGLAMAAEEQGARLFSNGIQTSLVLKTDADLNTEQRAQLKDSLNQTHAGSGNAFKTLLLESGLSAEKIGLTAQESQYIESRSYQLSDIARIFRVPGVLLGLGGPTDKTATFASAEQFFLSYVKHTIMPWTIRIEQTIQRDLLAPSETRFYAKHELNGLLRADIATRYGSHKIGIESGFLTRNEARSMEDLPLLDGLDTPLTPLNMAPTGTPAGNTATFTSAEAMASRLAGNIAAHETRVLADGKDRGEVYSKLAGYIASRTGLPHALAEAYCKLRAATPSDEAEGASILRGLLLTGKFPV